MVIRFVVLVLMVSTAFAVEEGVCQSRRLEMEEIEEGLEAMWKVRPSLDCTTDNIDAATMTADNITYFFKGQYYWRLNGDHVAPGYPRLIQQDWDGLPGYLDAALTWKDGRNFFFKGHLYWSFHGKNMDDYYPRNISEGFCGIPDNIDGAVLWGPNNMAYFFKGDQYWRFDGGESCKPVPGDYPLPLSNWEKVPGSIDDAVQWVNGRTYFLKGKYYYRYNDYENDSNAGSPVEIHNHWGVRCEDLKCRIPPAALSNENEINWLQ